MNLNQRAKKGREAQQLLSNEIFSEALSNLRQAIYQKWQVCPVRDKEGQSELHLMNKLLTDLEKNIKAFVTDGVAAEFEIEHQKKQEKLKEKLGKFF